MLLDRGFVLPDAFGNALGNSLVKRVSDYQEERLRETEKLSQNMAAIDAKNASGFAVDGLLGTLGKIDQDVADNIHDDFYGELFVSTQLNDQLAGIASDKNANAIFKYNAMSAQVKRYSRDRATQPSKCANSCREMGYPASASTTEAD